MDLLLREGDWCVTVLDNFDSYYDPAIKRRNIEPHFDKWNFELVEADIRDRCALQKMLGGEYDVIVHLAAKAGVRPSIGDPQSYQDVNVCGTQNMLELARTLNARQFVFASSSSVYGVNPNVPWCEEDKVLMPISPYASTKVSGELLGHVYAHLYGIHFVALRLFTVYGPRQRPDLAIHKFTRKIMEGEPISFFGDGYSKRDYTLVSDIVEGIRAAMEYRASLYEVMNLGSGRPISLAGMVQAIETVLGKHANIDRCGEQPGDVPQTYASIAKARKLLGYEPRTEFEEGIKHFVAWLRNCRELRPVEMIRS